MGRPRLYDGCPECGSRWIRVLQTKKRGFCVVRYVVCDVCGRRFRFVTARGDGGHESKKKADR